MMVNGMMGVVVCPGCGNMRLELELGGERQTLVIDLTEALAVVMVRDLTEALAKHRNMVEHRRPGLEAMKCEGCA